MSTSQIQNPTFANAHTAIPAPRATPANPQVHPMATNSAASPCAVVMLLLCVVLISSTISQAATFGTITDSFPLLDVGYDTAGGATIDDNYFHTESGIEVRDASGSLTGIIPLPLGADIYGVSHDGTNLSVGDMAGSTIYTFDGSLWDGGLGVSESGARGLAASDDSFYMIVDDGATIARINKTSGVTEDKYAIDGILGEGLGLGYIPGTNELVATNATDELYRLKLTDDLSAIDSFEAVPTSGWGSDSLFGAGYNNGNGHLILNDTEVNGLYAEGVIPEPATLALLALGGTAIVAKRRRRE